MNYVQRGRARGGEPPAEATHKTGGRASTFG